MSAAARGALAAWGLEAARLAALGAGHINDTWGVRAGPQRFVLQRLSAAVFPDPVQVADKVARVVAHLAGRRDVVVPAAVPCAGASWHRDAAGGVWRLWRFVEHARTLHVLESPAQGRAAGAAFGRLQRALAALPGPVPDPIPGFLQLAGYLAQLDAVQQQASGELEAAALATIERRRDLGELFTARDRLIQGDGKVDNLLYREGSDEIAAIIDLDTVMHGSWAWDFGDLSRSAAAAGGRVSVDRFASLAEGFVTSGALDDGPGGAQRREALVLAPRHLALMLGVRFLTDHLNGDRYFKVTARGDNLQRARQQLALLEDLERQEPALRRAIATL